MGVPASPHLLRMLMLFQVLSIKGATLLLLLLL
jgi:hypothetical protein